MHRRSAAQRDRSSAQRRRAPARPRPVFYSVRVRNQVRAPPPQTARPGGKLSASRPKSPLLQPSQAAGPREPPGNQPSQPCPAARSTPSSPETKSVSFTCLGASSRTWATFASGAHKPTNRGPRARAREAGVRQAGPPAPLLLCSVLPCHSLSSPPRPPSFFLSFFFSLFAPCLYPGLPVSPLNCTGESNGSLQGGLFSLPFLLLLFFSFFAFLLTGMISPFFFN